MSASSYFRRQERELQRLHAHGLSSCPTTPELVDYAMDIADKFDALCSALGVDIREEYPGCWSVRIERGEADSETTR